MGAGKALNARPSLAKGKKLSGLGSFSPFAINYAVT
jgi:hypothetical protein